MSETRAEGEYQTYLLRLWREPAAPAQRQQVWRCSIEDARTHNRRGFRSVEDFANHLRALAGKPCEACEPTVMIPEEKPGVERAKEQAVAGGGDRRGWP